MKAGRAKLVEKACEKIEKMGYRILDVGWSGNGLEMDIVAMPADSMITFFDVVEQGDDRPMHEREDAAAAWFAENPGHVGCKVDFRTALVDPEGRTCTRDASNGRSCDTRPGAVQAAVDHDRVTAACAIALESIGYVIVTQGEDARNASGADLVACQDDAWVFAKVVATEGGFDGPSGDPDEYKRLAVGARTYLDAMGHTDAGLRIDKICLSVNGPDYGLMKHLVGCTEEDF